MRLFDKLFSSSVGRQVSDSPEMASVLCMDAIMQSAVNEWKQSLNRGATFDRGRFPFCRPPWSVSFVEANNAGLLAGWPDLRQAGAFTVSLKEQVKIQASSVMEEVQAIKAAGATEMFCSTLVANLSRERILVPCQSLWGIDDGGGLVKARYLMAAPRHLLDEATIKALSIVSNLILESLLLSFTFCNCSNVKLEDVTNELQPEPKIRRRLKLPEVKRYTLNIAGHIARPSRDYDQGPQGVMPFHLCRGHFATYTSERPLFGKYTGRFWIPPHMKGKKENGEIIKDYAIADDSQATAGAHY